MDFGTSEDEKMLVAAARRFGDERLRPLERAAERDRAYPDELVAEYAALGFTHLGIPEAHDGLGLPLAQCVGVWAAIAEADPGAPMGLCPWGGLGAILHALGEGRVVARPPQGTLIPWIPTRARGGVLIVDEGGEAAWFEPAIDALPSRPCGLQACGGVSAQLEGPGRSVRAPAALDTARALAAALMLGAARDASSYAAAYARERVAFGKPIAHHQAVAFLLTSCLTDVDAAQLLLESACAAHDSVAIANAHAFVAEVALRCSERAVQVLGGHGYLYDHPMEKRMRDVRALATLYGGVASSEATAADRVLDVPGVMEGW